MDTQTPVKTVPSLVVGKDTIPEIASFNFISQFVLWPLGVVVCGQNKPEFYSLVKSDL